MPPAAEGLNSVSICSNVSATVMCVLPSFLLSQCFDGYLQSEKVANCVGAYTVSASRGLAHCSPAVEALSTSTSISHVAEVSSGIDVGTHKRADDAGRSHHTVGN